MSTYDNDLPKWQNYIRKADMNEEMRSTVLKFDMIWGSNIRPATRIFYLKCLRILAVNFKDKKPGEITKDDLIVFFDRIRNTHGARLVEQIKLSAKKFFKELYGTEEYPELVKWIKPTRNSKPTVTREMLITPEEVLKIVQACKEKRDKAFVMMLYELAGRASELMNVKIKDLFFNSQGASVMIWESKSEARRLPLLHSVHYLKDWLNSHPTAGNEESYLWVCVGRKNYAKPLQLDPLRARIKKIAAGAGIEKRIWLHLFRHSQLTNLVKMGYSEFYLRKHAGWSANSKMAETYVKLAFDDVAQKYYEVNGIHPETEENNGIRIKTCGKCGEANPPTNKVCNKCLYVLDLKTAMELDEKRRKIDAVMDMLFQRPKFKELVEAELEEIEKERRASSQDANPS